MRVQPLVSVIMPAYNAGKFIGYAIESIINQTYTNWELIIIEDKSTDNTLSVIQNYTDDRIRLYKNDRNRGISFSTNRGIQVSRGKYIALLDDDDEAMPERLEKQVNYMEENSMIDILGGGSVIIDKYGKMISWTEIPRSNPKYIKAILLLFYNSDFYNGTAMIRKQFIVEHQLQYQDNCYGMQDYKFYMDSSKLGNISAINEFLLKYRLHDSNESIRNRMNFSKERALTFAKFQRESIIKSGFQLDEKYLQIINKTLAVGGGKCDSMEEFRLLYEAFHELIEQGKNMDIDYSDELTIYCKKLLSNQFCKLDLFDRKYFDFIMC